MSNSSEVPSDIAAMSFEDALAELERIVRELETGTARLEDSIAAYERGSHLKAHCERKLREAQAKVEKISKAADGTVDVGPAGLD
jgi:exodeoxyribonuclease VII small subunit